MSNNSNSVSIPVSDNELDDMERMRVRVRRKRKKQGNRVNNELAPRVFKMMLKYWLVVFFLLAAGLLLFEATKIGQNSRLETKSEFAATTTPKLDDSKLETVKESGLDKKPDGNLNRLDPVTRMVNGVRERKLLSTLKFLFVFSSSLHILAMRICSDFTLDWLEFQKMR